MGIQVLSEGHVMCSVTSTGSRDVAGQGLRSELLHKALDLFF